MKILLIHNYHRKGSASGDDLVYRNEAELLEHHGHQVIRYTVNNDTFDAANILGKMRLTASMLWSFSHYHNVFHICKTEHPDIVHVHTFFPLLSPAVLYAAKKSGCRVVATLHDTRFICPCATSLREGELCNLCGDGHYYRMVKYCCFKHSRIMSLIVAFIFSCHRRLKSFYKTIDCYICLNDNQIRLLSDIGFQVDKITKKYNFVEDKLTQVDTYEVNPDLPPRYVVFFGRIGEEKGIRQLMSIWDLVDDIPLVVMGDGPLRDEFSQWADEKKNVFYLGYTEHRKCLGIVNQAEFVVFPSIWYEGCSMVVIETESMGKPIVVSDIGFTSEAIDNGKNGYKIPMGDIEGFANRVCELWNSPHLCKMMGESARADYEAKYMKENNYELLMEVYKSVL